MSRVQRRMIGIAAAAAAALAVVSPAVHATTVPPDTTASSDTAAASGEPLLVYGVFATPLEEPWDGAIHTAIEAVAESGAIEYKWVDGLGDIGRDGARPARHHRDRRPDLIIGDAFAAEEAVRAVAADYPDTAFAFGSGLAEAGAELQRVRQLDAGPCLPRRDAGRRAHRIRDDRCRRGDADPRGQPHRQRVRHGSWRDQRRRHGQRVVHQLVLRPGDGGPGRRGPDRPGRRRALRRAGRGHRGRRRERPARVRDDGRPARPRSRQRRRLARVEHATDGRSARRAGVRRDLRGAEPGAVLVHDQRRQLADRDQHRRRGRSARRTSSPSSRSARPRSSAAISRRRSTTRRRRGRSTSPSR